MPDTFTTDFNQLSNAQFTTQAQVEAYLNMTEAFSGQPLKLTNQQNI